MAIINFNNMFFLNIYLFLLYFCLCETDFDYNRKKRLNNGNYLIMSTQGIYLYNEYFNRKKNLTIFESRLANSISEIYSSDIDQFLSEDNGYIICLIKNETYFLSRNGTLLQHITLDYIIETLYYNIIPYGYLNNEYYYVIINIESQKIMIREYIYDSSNNNINFKKSYIYNVSEVTKEGITCELMYYNIHNKDNKVITCFYGDWESTFYIVLNTINFNLISGYGGKIPNDGGINGGKLFVSSIIPDKRDVVMICSQHSGNYKCFLYNITNNNFTSAVTIQNDSCLNENLNMVVEYFPETDEFLVGCKNYLNNLYIGKFTSNYIFKSYGKITIEEVSALNLFHFIFSSNGNYSVVVDTGEYLNERVISLDIINSVKLNDYPTDEIGILICNKY